MLRLLRRAAGIGLAASALGLMPPSAAAGLDAGPVKAEHREARQVEHAWMSDPRTFALPLEADGDEDGLVVRGKVPDEATRRHAVRLARQATSVPVQDRLTVDEASKALADARPAALKLAAAALIRERLGANAGRIRVVSEGDGIIELHGSAVTLEERLAATRCLRNLPGITRVENYLDSPKPGQVVQTAGVAAEEAKPAPAPALAPALAPPPSPTEYPTGPGPLVLPAPPPPRMPAAVPSNTYVRIQTRPAPVEPAPRPVLQSSPVGYAQPAYPGCVVTGRGVQLSVAELEPTPTFLERFAGMFAFKAKPPRAAVRVQADRPVVARMETPEPAPAPMPVPAPPPAAGSAPRPSAPLHVTAWPPAHRSAGDTLVTVPIAAKPMMPAALAGGNEPPLLPAQEATPVPPPQAAMAPTAPAPSTRPAPRVVLSGAKVSTEAPAPAKARQLVVKACGKLARGVQATLDQDGKLLLQVHAAPKAEQDIAGLLLSLPELQGGNVHIQIHVAP